jgi:hypothetical protein
MTLSGVRESEQARVVIVGLGPIGRGAAVACSQASDLVVVGAIDPAHAGEEVGGVVVRGVEHADELSGDVALVATATSLDAISADLERLVSAGLHVVSTCEELAYPWRERTETARRLDDAARANGVAVLGVGVNPGFVMDVVPALPLTASLDARFVSVSRRVDLSRRRPQLRKKLGVGLAVAEWERDAERRTLGHVGLVESAILCALALGSERESVTFRREPILRTDRIVNGVRERAELEAEDGRAVELELVFEEDGADVDVIEVRGRPDIRVVFEGGVQGDDATVARLVSGARIVGTLPPGLRLPIEAPPWSSPLGRRR